MQFDQHGRDLLASTAIALMVRLIGAATQFAFNVMLARLLGAQGMGLYALALSVSTIASIVGRLGMDFSIMRFVATHRETDQRSRLKHGWRSMMGYACLFSIAITLFLFILAPYISDYIFAKPELTTPLRWMLISIVPFSLLNLLAESLRALERVGEASLVQAGMPPVFSIIFFLFLFNAGLGVQSAVLGYILATIVVTIIAYLLWQCAVPQLNKVPARGGPSLREILHTSVPIVWLSIAGVIMALADTVILGIFRPVPEVGIYSAAMRVSLLLSIVVVAANGMLAPKFAALHKNGEHANTERLAQLGSKLMLLLALPPALVFVVFPGKVMSIFGVQFMSGATVLVILSIGQLINVAAGPVGLLLLMTGYERQIQWVNTATMVFNIVLAFILVPTFGMIGAAIAITTSLVLLNLLYTFATIKHVKVSPIPWIYIAQKVMP